MEELLERLLIANLNCNHKEEQDCQMAFARIINSSKFPLQTIQKICDYTIRLHGHVHYIAEAGIAGIFEYLSQEKLMELYNTDSGSFTQERLSIPVKYLALSKINDQEFLINEIQALNKNVEIGVIDAEPNYTNRKITFSYLIASVKSDEDKIRLINCLDRRNDVVAYRVLGTMSDEYKELIIRNVLFNLEDIKHKNLYMGVVEGFYEDKPLVRNSKITRKDFNNVVNKVGRDFVFAKTFKNNLINLLKTFENKDIATRILMDFDKKDFEYIDEIVEDDTTIVNLLASQNYTELERYKLIKKIKQEDIRDGLIENNPIYKRLKALKLEESDSLIGIDPSLKFGVELEAIGAKAKVCYQIFQDLDKEVQNFSVVKDSSIPGGSEIVSPILKDNPYEIGRLEYITNAMSIMGFFTNQNCGGHIHFDAAYLKVNGSNEEALYNLNSIFKEAEEIFYKISNPKGQVIRKSARKYASKVSDVIEIVNTRKSSQFKDGAKDYSSLLLEEQGGSRYYGINFSNLEVGENNSIEIRIPNGTININELKENIYLYGKLMEVSKDMVINPQKYEEKLSKYKKRDVSEREKLESLLDLLFEDEKSKLIYRERWNSVKTRRIYKDFSSRNEGFIRGDYTLEGQTKKMLGLTIPHDVYVFGKKIKETIKSHINSKDEK